jgi:hypothetical protein
MEATMSEEQNLPALIDQAAQRLLNARTSAEVVQAHKLADAAFHVAQLCKAAKKTQADCLRIIFQAEIRLADEYNAAQARGEVQKPGGDRKIIIPHGNNDPPTVTDIGLSSKLIYQARQTLDLGSDGVNKAINEALASNQPMTKETVRKAARSKKNGENKVAKAQEIICPLVKAGENPTYVEMEEQHGMSRTVSDRARAAELGRIEGEEIAEIMRPIDTSALSPSVQQRFNALEKRLRKQMEITIAEQVRIEVKRLHDEDQAHIKKTWAHNEEVDTILAHRWGPSKNTIHSRPISQNPGRIVP